MKRFLLTIGCFIYISLIFAQQEKINRAKSHIASEEYVEAAKILRPLTEEGNTEALYWAATLFKDGKGVVKNKEQADKYFLSAAEQGHGEATLSLLRYCLPSPIPNEELQFFKNEFSCNPQDKALINFMLGYYYYETMAPEGDLNRGWNLMLDNRQGFPEWKKILQKRNDTYYHWLIDSYLTDDLHKRLLVLFYQKKCYNDVLQYVGYIMDRIRKLDVEAQGKILSVWKDTSSIITWGIVGMMYCEGIGVNKDLRVGSSYLKKTKEKIFLDAAIRYKAFFFVGDLIPNEGRIFWVDESGKNAKVWYYNDNRYLKSNLKKNTSYMHYVQYGSAPYKSSGKYLQDWYKATAEELVLILPQASKEDKIADGLQIYWTPTGLAHIDSKTHEILETYTFKEIDKGKGKHLKKSKFNHFSVRTLTIEDIYEPVQK